MNATALENGYQDLSQKNGLLHKVNVNMSISNKKTCTSNCKGQEQVMDNDDRILLLLGSLGNLK